MKTKLAVLLFLFAPALQSSTEWVIEQGLIVWESELVAYEGANRAYAGMFQFDPVAHAYFAGKADAYADLLLILRIQPPAKPAPENPK